MRPVESNDTRLAETDLESDLFGTTAALHSTARRVPPSGGERNAHRRIRRRECGLGDRG